MSLCVGVFQRGPRVGSKEVLRRVLKKSSKTKNGFNLKLLFLAKINEIKLKVKLLIQSNE